MGYTSVVVDESSKYTSAEGTPKTENKYYRYKKRVYLEDIQSIENYIYHNFRTFTKASLTSVILYNGEAFVTEMKFKMVEQILDKFDQQRTLIINN